MKETKKTPKKLYLTGSFDSLGRGEVKAGKEWKGHKMMNITKFLYQYDPNFIRQEDYV